MTPLFHRIFSNPHRDRLGGMIVAAVMLIASPAAADVFEAELTKAMTQSDQIKAAREGYLSSREDVTIANKSKDWSASLSASHKYSETSTSGASFVTGNNRDLSVTVKRSLYDGGLSSTQNNVALLNLEIADTRIRSAEDLVLMTAIEAYTNLVTARDSLRISRSNVTRLKEHLRAATIQLQVGESTMTELAGTKARLARAEASLIQSQTALANAEATYTSLIGTPPSSLTMPDVANGLPLDMGAAGDQALDYKASHRIAYLQERVARKSMDVLLAQIRPNLDLSVVGSTTDNTIAAFDKEIASATITFSVPLYPSSSVRAKSRGSVADHRQALYNLMENKRQTLLQAENAFRSYASNRAVISAYEAELDAAEAVQKGTMQEVQYGEKTILDQLDAEQDVVAAQLNLLVARRDLVNASYRLKSAIGQLTAEGMNLEGLGKVENEVIETPLKGIIPKLDYPE
jgi:outer membrane protein